MTVYQCLSVCGPCETICERCIKACDDYTAREIEKKTNDSIRWLEYQGYVVVKDHMRGIVTL